MTRPVLLCRPRTPGCRGLGYFPHAGRDVLLHPLGLPVRGVGAPTRALCSARRRHLCSRDFCSQPPCEGVRGSPARTSPRGHPAPGPTRAAPRGPSPEWQRPGGRRCLPGGQRRQRRWRRDLRPGPREEEKREEEEEGKEEEEEEREAFSAQTAAGSSGHGDGDTPLVAPPF